jgi:hypothetical protein
VAQGTRPALNLRRLLALGLNYNGTWSLTI